MIVKELFAKLGLDVDESGFSKGDLLIGGLKKGLQTLGGLLVGAAVGIGAMVVNTAQTAKEIQLLSQSAGVTANDLQELAYAGSKAGLDLEEMGRGLIMLTKNMSAARDGSDGQSKAFAALGVSVVGADGKLRDSGDTLQAIADKFKSMPDGPEKTAAALELFGRSGAKMIPLLNKGGDGIEELRNKAHDLGLVLDDSAMKGAGEFRGAMSSIKENATALQYAIAGPLMGTIAGYLKTLGEWIKGNRALTMQRVDKVIGAIKIAAAVLLPILRTVLSVFGFLIDNWKLIAILLTSVVLAAIVVNAEALMALGWAYASAGAAGVWAAIKVGAAWVLANLPLFAMMALFALIILLFDDVKTALGGGDSLMKSFLGDWNDDAPEDPWWLRDIKKLAYLIMHFDEIMKFWKEQFKDFWDFLTDGFKSVGDDMADGWKKIFGGDTRADLRKKSLDGWEEAARAADEKAAAAVAVGQFSGAAADPIASALSSGVSSATTGSIVTSSSPITVIAGDGMSKEELAAEVAKQVELNHQRALEEAQ